MNRDDFGATVPTVDLDMVVDAEKEKFFDFIIENKIKLSQEGEGSYVSKVNFLEAPKEQKHFEESSALTDNVECKKKGNGGTLAIIFKEFLKKVKSAKQPKLKGISWTARCTEEIYDSKFDMIPVKEDSKDSSAIPSFPLFVYSQLYKQFKHHKGVDQICIDLAYTLQCYRAENLQFEVFSRFLEEYYDENDLLFYLYVRSTLEAEVLKSAHVNKTSLSLNLTWRQAQLLAKKIFGAHMHDLRLDFLEVIDKYIFVDEEGEQFIEALQFLHVALAHFHDAKSRKDFERRSEHQKPPASEIDHSFDAKQQVQTGMRQNEDARIESTSSPLFANKKDFSAVECHTADETPKSDYNKRNSSNLMNETTTVESNKFVKCNTNHLTQNDHVEREEESCRSSEEVFQPCTEPSLEKISAAVISKQQGNVPSAFANHGLQKIEIPAGSLIKGKNSPLETSANKAMSITSKKLRFREKGCNRLQTATSILKTEGLTLTEQVLYILKHKLQRERRAYVEELLHESKGLPLTIQEELSTEIGHKLEEKVRQIINDVAGAKRQHKHMRQCEAIPDSCIYYVLQKKFRHILRQCRESGEVDYYAESLIEDYAKTILYSTEIRQEVEPLVALLVTYANARVSGGMSE